MCIPVLLYSVAQAYNESNPFMHMQPSVAQRWVAQRNARLRNAKLHYWDRTANTGNIATDLFFQLKRSATVAITKKCHYYFSCAATSLHGHHGIDRASPAP